MTFVKTVNLSLFPNYPWLKDVDDDIRLFLGNIQTNEDTAIDESSLMSGNLFNEIPQEEDDDDDDDDDKLIVATVNGETANVGQQLMLSTGGLLMINQEGTFDFNPNLQYEDLAVGETRTDSFTFSFTEKEELEEILEGEFDEIEGLVSINLTVTGVNDAPIISIIGSDSKSDTVAEANSTLSTTGTLTVSDVDTTDLVTASVISVATSGQNNDLSTPDNATLLSMLSVTPAEILDGTETTDTLTWNFNSAGEAFNYLADDENLVLTYTVKAQDDNDASDTQTVTITVDGTNDRPVAQDLNFTIGEDDSPFTDFWVAFDLDTTDVLSYQLVAGDDGEIQPVDRFGNQYGKVINNGNGTFTFDPLDNFQFLDDNEFRDVTFQYVAIDDSSTANNTSEVKSVTVRVTGNDDAPIDLSDNLLFETSNQSMFGSGEALVLQPDLPFFGIEESASLNSTIIESQTFSGPVLEGILGGIEAVGQFFSDAGCAIIDFFGGDCDDPPDVDIPDSVTIPKVGTTGNFAIKTGLQPYFEFTSGDVDSSLPVEVVFTTPRQVEASDTFTIGSAYTLDGGATFNTMSPNVKFGMDFVFDLDSDLAFNLGTSNFELFDINTANISGFTGELGEPGFNIFNFSAEENLETSIDLGGLATLDLNFPVINTTGAPNPVGSNTTLTSSGEDDVAVFNLDVDAVIAQLIELATGVPVTFGESGSEGVLIDIAGQSLNLLSFEYDWDLVAIDLISTLTAVQDFSLEIEELPLIVTREDGLIIDDVKINDEITMAPLMTGFDPDVADSLTGSNGDGIVGWDVDIDMGAIFSNLSTLDFDLELFTGLLSFTGGITSDFFNGPSFDLFGPGGILDDPFDTGDSFLLSNTLELVNISPLATLFNESFDLEGWNTESFAGAYDVA